MQALRQNYLALATDMATELKTRAISGDEQRRVPAENIELFKQAGFFNMLKPTRFGGAAMSPKDFYDVVFEVSRYCPSSGWVLSVVGVHSWQLGLFHDQAQEEVWGNDPGALISSSYMPAGKVTCVDGGYRLSGHWQFSSGCDHCSWVMLGGMVPPAEEGAPPQLHTFLLPRADYEIVDDWFTTGLKASGSKAIVVDDVFVPSHRTHSFMDGFMRTSPGIEVNPEPVYKLPFGQVFVRAVSMPAVGAAQGALDHYLAYNLERVNSRGTSAVELPATLRAASDAQSVIRAARLKMHNCYDTLMQWAESGADMPHPERAEFRYDAAHAVDSCLGAVQQLLANSGGRAIYTSNDVNHYMQDLLAFRQHAMNEPDKASCNLGRIMMGLDTEEFFI